MKQKHCSFNLHTLHFIIYFEDGCGWGKLNVLCIQPFELFQCGLGLMTHFSFVFQFGEHACKSEMMSVFTQIMFLKKPWIDVFLFILLTAI